MVIIAFSLAIVAARPIFSGERRIQAEPEAQHGRLGYLLNLELQGSQTRMDSAADIDDYIGTEDLPAGDDWYVALVDADGNNISTEPIGNPYHLFPHVSANQAVPLTVTIPRFDGLTEVIILNQSREDVFRIYIDDSFRQYALA